MDIRYLNKLDLASMKSFTESSDSYGFEPNSLYTE